MAEIMGKRSRCDRRKVGAIIVDGFNKIQASAYNGPPAGARYSGGCLDWCPRAQHAARVGMDPSDDDGDVLLSYRNCPSLHAEANALLEADHTKIRGGTIYVSSAVCADCAKLIANSGLLYVEMTVWASDQHRRPETVCRYLTDMGLTVYATYPERRVMISYRQGQEPDEIVIAD